MPNDQDVRNRTKVLIARQIGLMQGFVWRDGIDTGDQGRKKRELLTYAENILATVERGVAEIKWA